MISGRLYAKVYWRSSAPYSGRPVRCERRSRRVTWLVTQGSERAKPGFKDAARSSQPSSPLPTMDAIDAEAKDFEMDASWKRVSGVTGSPEVIFRTPNVRRYTTVSFFTTATAMPGTPL